MLSRRQVEVITAVLVLIALVVVLFLIFRKPQQTVETTTETETQTQAMPEVQPEDVLAVSTVSAGTVTRTFIERFGSYSSESNFANVDDILSLATPEYRTELEALVAGYRRNFDATAGYSGVSTVVITLKATAETETTATFAVTTQREEAVGNPGNTTLRYQDAEVSLVKAGDNWLVNDLVWK